MKLRSLSKTYANLVKATLPRALTLFAALVVFGCGGGGSSGVSPDLVVANPPPILSTLFTGNIRKDSGANDTYRVSINGQLSLDASASRDPDGQSINYEWALTGKPSGSKAELVTKSTGVVTITPDILGNYVINLKVIDSLGGTSTQSITMIADNQLPSTTISSVVSLPISTPSQPNKANVGDAVLLNAVSYPGSNASTIQQHAWAIKSKPSTSSAALVNPNTDSPYFYPDVLGEYLIYYKVTDNLGAINEKEMKVMVDNYRPSAVIFWGSAPSSLVSAPFTQLPVGTTTVLRGGNSTDPDGDISSYAWTLSNKPAASNAILTTPTSVDSSLTLDVAGSYEVKLRVTDSKGAYSETVYRVSTFKNTPTVITDRSRILALLGGSASVSAAASYDDSGSALSFLWTLDSKPTGSTATVAGPNQANLSFTPDLVGTYVLSVAVSNATRTAYSSITIEARSALTGAVPLNFTPQEAKYSRALDLLAITTSAPNTLKTVEPGTGVIKTINLPLPSKSLAISPNGLFAAVAHDAAISYVDLAQSILVRTVGTNANHVSVALSDRGLAYALESNGGSNFVIADLNAGTLLPNTNNNVYISGQTSLILSSRASKIFYANDYSSSSGPGYITFDATSGLVTGNFSGNYNSSYQSRSPLWLSESQDLIFTSAGTRFRASNSSYAGTLAGYTANASLPFLSMSHSQANDELLAVYSATPTVFTTPYIGYDLVAEYQRYTGAFFAQATSLPMPLISSVQSYALGVFHSGTGAHVLLAQTGSTTPKPATGASYYVLFR